MKRVTAALAIALSAAAFSPAQAQLSTNLQFRTPLNYRFPVQPRSHVFAYRHRHHHHHRWRHRHRALLPVLTGPAVIYRNGDIGIPPEEDFTAAVPAAAAQPVVHRIGETGGCGLEQVGVPGSHGRTTVNIWRC